MKQKEFEKTMKVFLESGVHFGHKSNIWNPNMKKYVFVKRNGVHIIDLQKTVLLFEKAYNYIRNMCANGGKILFVGTKKQAKAIVKEEISKTSHYYISNRWVGGLLTNNKTVNKSINRLKELNLFLENEEEKKKYPKKQILKFGKERDKLMNDFQGILNMEKLPDLIFIIDSFHEKNCVQEAKIMGIPTCAMVDTNCDPRDIDILIPSNDDAIRSINFFISKAILAIEEGEEIYKKNKKIEDLALNYSELKENKESLIKNNEEKKNLKDTKNNKKIGIISKPVNEKKVIKSNKKTEVVTSKEENDMNIKPIMIKELRRLTNIGMMECKKALVQAKGDKDKAIKILKEKGLAIISKRQDKETNEGVIFLKNDTQEGWMVKVSCETDFVSKSKIFGELVEEIGKKFVNLGASFLEEEESKKKLNEKIAQTKEKISISDPIHLKTDKGLIVSYLHSNKKIGVLVELESKNQENIHAVSDIKTFAKDVAMQIAAMNPLALSLSNIDPKVVQEQKEFFLKQMQDEKKDPKILEKIIAGKTNKYFSEQCLLEMESVKEDKKTINTLIQEIGKKNKIEFIIKRFKRHQIGGK